MITDINHHQLILLTQLHLFRLYKILALPSFFFYVYFLPILLPVSNIPAWFTVDTRLGCLSVHLDTPQCFSGEMYSADLNIVGKPEDDKVNAFILISNLLYIKYQLPKSVLACFLIKIYESNS